MQKWGDCIVDVALLMINEPAPIHRICGSLGMQYSWCRRQNKTPHEHHEQEACGGRVVGDHKRVILSSEYDRE